MSALDSIDELLAAIRSEAAISYRSGSMDRLELIALGVANLVADLTTQLAEAKAVQRETDAVIAESTVRPAAPYANHRALEIARAIRAEGAATNG